MFFCTTSQNHPHDDEPPPRPPGRNTELKNKCTVCLKEINPRDREFLKCNHMFHHDCYVDMLLKVSMFLYCLKIFVMDE